MSQYFGFEPVEFGDYYFISYNSQDTARISAIACEMYKNSIPMWYDRGLKSGKEWEQQIVEKIRDCHEVIMFVTQNLLSRSSSYVMVEYDIAKSYKKNIIIVNLDNVPFEKVNVAFQGWYSRVNNLRGICAYNIRNPRSIMRLMEEQIRFLRSKNSVTDGEMFFIRLKAFVSTHKKQFAAFIFIAAFIALSYHLASNYSNVLLEAVNMQGTGQVDTADTSQDVFEYITHGDTVTITVLKDTSLSKVTIPDKIEDKKVTIIDKGAFKGMSSISGITFSSNLETIGSSAFEGCTSLLSVTLPNSVSVIESAAFAGCTSLQSVTISTSVTSIGDYCFSGCSSLISVIIPNSVTEISNNVFENCVSLKSVDIPGGTIRIKERAFSGCNALREMVLPDSIVEIEGYAFENCQSLKSIDFSENLTSIGEYAFHNCTVLRELTIPDGVNSIGKHAFENCSSIIRVQYPDGTDKVQDYCFYNCKSISSFDFGDGVTRINDYAFANCTALGAIYLPERINYIADNAFDGAKNVRVAAHMGSYAERYAEAHNCMDLSIG